MDRGDIYKKILFAAAGIDPDEGLTAESDPGKTLYLLSEWYKGLDRRGRYRVRKAFTKLNHLELIESTLENNEKKVVLTDAGRKKITEYQLESLRPEQPKEWDKKWRLVTFNVPESLKSSRNLFRNKLKDLGFVVFQKSIFIYPYECQNEINHISQFLGIRPHVKLIEASHFDGEELFREKFNLL